MKYKVPFINYSRHYLALKKEIDMTLQGVLSRGDLILRCDVKNFENKLASFAGRKYGIGVGSCTGAMFLSLCAAGIGRGDEIITVSHTYIASIDVIVHCGAKPVLIDIGEDFNMNVELLEEAITKKTKAIIPVHLNGRTCNMDKLMKVARRYNLAVIEDAAQALGAKFNGKMAGSFGLTGCFSFYPAKMLGALGDAGMIVTDSRRIADKLYLLRDHGEKPGYLKKSAERNKKDIALFGFNSILDNIQAAVLSLKLTYLPQWIKKRREMAELYNKALITAVASIMEPFGLVAVESMACSTPVVAVNEAGLRETVTKETGILTDRDEAGFALAIEYLMRNPRVAQEIGIRGRERVTQRFTWSRAVGQLEEEMLRLVKR